MKLLRVAIVGAVALLGATCAASSCSDESSISGSTDSDYLVGRSSFTADFRTLQRLFRACRKSHLSNCTTVYSKQYPTLILSSLSRKTWVRL